jgi:hypothetical protein
MKCNMNAKIMFNSQKTLLILKNANSVTLTEKTYTSREQKYQPPLKLSGLIRQYIRTPL